MAKDMRAKNATIKDLAERLSETAEAAEAAASAAHIMDKERKSVRNEIAKLRKDVDEKLQSSSLQVSFNISFCLWGVNLKEEKHQYTHSFLHINWYITQLKELPEYPQIF